MHEGVEDILDILLMLLLLGVSIQVGFSLMLPLLNIDYNFTDVALDDKSVPVLMGSEGEINYDGTMNLTELILMSQVQDHGMPYPRVIQTPKSRIDVDSFYKYDLINYGRLIYDDLKSNPSDSRYVIQYSYGVHNVSEDESYRIIKK